MSLPDAADVLGGTMWIRFSVVGTPQPQGSKVAGVAKSGRRFVRESNKNLASWRQLVLGQAQQHAPQLPSDGPIALRVAFWMPVPKSAPKRRRLPATKLPDLDKLVRSTIDGMRDVFFRNDSQIVRIEASKNLAYERPVGAEIELRVLA